MKLAGIIEKYFWVFLAAGILIGLWYPAPIKIPSYLPKLLLGMMLFLVFLKIDAFELMEKIRNFRLMIYISMVYMIIIPLFFYFLFRIFDSTLATGILLLTAMPAGVSTPALTDIAKGNITLAMTIVIVTQVIAPFSVPLLFWLVDFKGIEIDKLMVFKDIAILVFVPLIIAQLIKRNMPGVVRKNQHFFTSLNVILLFAFVYLIISSQRNVLLANPVSLIWKTAILYLVFVMLHFTGYMLRYRESKENRIAFSITAAYMNNGLAIVLASTYFGPEILILMVLSEIPWNTLLAPFKRVAGMLQ